MTFTTAALLAATAVGQGQPQTDTVTVAACVAREADYVRAAGTPTLPEQLLLAAPGSGAPTHSLTGLREGELVRYVGQRVEIVGIIEPSRTGAQLTVIDAVTPDGATAHEPSDGVAVAVAPVREAAGNVADPAYRAATVPRLNVVSFRAIAGDCARPPASAPSPPQPSARVAPIALAARGPTRITARGCLARLTKEGTALTAQRAGLDPLVLTNASVPEARAGAVAQRPPTDRGSGTVPAPAGTSSRGGAPLTFALEVSGERAKTLAALVGDRVEIVGTVDEAQGQAPAGGHASAPVQRIAVLEFRLLGGSCR